MEPRRAASPRAKIPWTESKRCLDFCLQVAAFALSTILILFPQDFRDICTMPTIKIACPKCGQKVSGDETFAGSAVECPVCSAEIRFPGKAAVISSPGPTHPKTLPPPPVEPPATMVDDWLIETAPIEKAPIPIQASTPSPPPTKPEPHPRAIATPPAIAPEQAEEDLEDPIPSPLAGAIAMVAATLSIVSCGTLGILFAPLAIIAGHTALAMARRSPVRPAPGQTIGAVGMVLGYLSLAMTIVILLILVFFGKELRDAIPQWGV
jgi:DNA-directed RNA polymerase subunit RPC12/RpoP